MKRAITILFIILSLSLILNAQEKSDCPEVMIVGPPSSTSPGETMTFSVSLDKVAEKLDLEYEWKIDKGNILKGQGTNQIRVVTDGLRNETLTAKLKIKGFPEKCISELKETGIVIGGHPYPIDDFGKLKKKDIWIRIDVLIAHFQNYPDFIILIPQSGRLKKVRKREKLIKKHLKFRGMDMSKVIFKYSGKSQNIRTVFWVLPKDIDYSYID